MREYTIINPDPELKDNLMAFGFMCGAGWHPLIIELLDEIQDVVDRDEIEDFQVVEIKEKFGGLRVYVSHYTDEIADIIDKYEKKSFHICELCGERGRTRSVNGWITTICEKCYSESKK